MISTKEVIDQYIRSFGAGDLEAILSCHAADAVLFGSQGVSKGREAIRAFFKTVLTQFWVLGSSFEIEQRSIEGDSGYVRWSAAMVGNLGKIGCERFTVRGGMIVAHSFAARITVSADLRRETALARELARQLRPERAACDLEAYASAMLCTCSDLEPLLTSLLALH